LAKAALVGAIKVNSPGAATAIETSKDHKRGDTQVAVINVTVSTVGDPARIKTPSMMCTIPLEQVIRAYNLVAVNGNGR
jgi:hypothetical protein